LSESSISRAHPGAQQQAPDKSAASPDQPAAITSRDARSIDRVTAALTAVSAHWTERGDHVQASCPAHDDQSPSLSIDYRTGSGEAVTLLHCQAGCDTEAVLEALGLRATDLYDAPPTRPTGASSPRLTGATAPKAPRPPAGPACLGQYAQHRHAVPRSPEAADGCTWHPYTDPLGRPVAWKIRRPCGRVGCGDRVFAWRYLTADGEISARRDDRPAIMPLYRAEALTAARGTTLYITEGESDADAITEAGQLAVTHGNAETGSGATWRDHHTAAIQTAQPARVVVCADRDASGLGHRSAQYIAQQLLLAGLEAVEIQQAREGKDVRDHLGAGRALADLEVVEIQQASETTPAAEDLGQVVDIRTGRPAGPGGDPGPRLPMSSGSWAYSVGSPSWSRGVYHRADSRGQWHLIAPLPEISSRIIRRDGTGRRTGTDYRISAEAAGPWCITAGATLRDGSWADQLGWSLSDDDRVRRAAATAIRYAGEQTPETEARPRASAGMIQIPAAEAMPAGYLETTTGQGEAITALGQAIGLVGDTIALLLGASAIGPYVGPLGRQGHMIHTHSPAGGTGKTTATRLAASLWGQAGTDGMVRPWNLTSVGLQRYLGQLGVLPAYLDESGLATWQGEQWGRIIFELTEGASRVRAESRGTGIQTGESWHGIVLSSGNARLSADIRGTRYGGIHRRLIELQPPFTDSARQAEQLGELARTITGWPGTLILRQYGVGPVGDLIGQTEQLLGLPEEGAARTIARHLASHIAGAVLLDQIAGTGTALADKATVAARRILDSWQPPESLADLALAAVVESIAGQPGRWPAQGEYLASLEADPDARARIRVSGLDRVIIGVQSDAGDWIAILPSHWRALCAEHGIDSADALGELAERGLILAPDSARAARTHQAVVKLPWSVRVYKIALPEGDAPPVTGPVTCPVTGPVTCPTPALACEVTSVTCLEPIIPRASVDMHPVAEAAEPEPETAPQWGTCLGCGDPLRMYLGPGTLVHPSCDMPAPGPCARPGCHLPLTITRPGQTRHAACEAQAAIDLQPAEAPRTRRELTGAERLHWLRRITEHGIDPSELTDQVLEQTALLLDRHVRHGTEGRTALRIEEGGIAATARSWLSYTTAIGEEARAKKRRPATAPLPAAELKQLHTMDRLTVGSWGRGGDWQAGEPIAAYDVTGAYPNAAGLPLGLGTPELLELAPDGWQGQYGWVQVTSLGAGIPGWLLPRMRPGMWLATQTAAEMIKRATALEVAPPTIGGAWLWPDRSQVLEPLAADWSRGRRGLEGEPESLPRRIALWVLKAAINRAFGGLLGSTRYGVHRMYRPDWTAQIAENALLRLHFHMDRAGLDSQIVGAYVDAVIVATDRCQLTDQGHPVGLQVLPGRAGKLKLAGRGRLPEATDPLLGRLRAGQGIGGRDGLTARLRTQKEGQ
jgi:hypothetical protein